MSRKLSVAAIICLLPFTFTAFAEEAKEKPEYSLSAELGFLYKTGNTKSADIKAGIDFSHEKDQWLSTVDFNVVAKKLESTDDNGDDSFDTTDSKWNIVTKTNYTLSPEGKNYLYGYVSYEEDRFSNFDKQASVSLGWGRQWYKTKKSSLFADVGPGYKHDVVKASGMTPQETKNSLIIQAQAIYHRQINDFVEFKQLLVAQYATKSDANSTYKSESSITTKLIESLQLKFALTIDYNTEVDAGFDNTDTQTSMTLVYNF